MKSFVHDLMKGPEGKFLKVVGMGIIFVGSLAVLREIDRPPHRAKTSSPPLENVVVNPELKNLAIQAGGMVLRRGRQDMSSVTVTPVDGNQTGEAAITFTSITKHDINYVSVHMDTLGNHYDANTTNSLEIWRQPLDSTSLGLDVIISRKQWPDGTVVWHGSDISPGHDYEVNKGGIRGQGNSADLAHIVYDARALIDEANLTSAGQGRS